MSAWPPFPRRTFARFSLSFLIAAFLPLGADAASKRKGTITAKPVEYARLFYVITGKSTAYDKCLQRISRVQTSSLDCALALSDLKSFAPGFDYDSRQLNDPYTACRVLEALSHLYNEENPNEPTRCNE